jgi:hypothetical protein
MLFSCVSGGVSTIENIGVIPITGRVPTLRIRELQLRRFILTA